MRIQNTKQDKTKKNTHHQQQQKSICNPGRENLHYQKLNVARLDSGLSSLQDCVKIIILFKPPSMLFCYSTLRVWMHYGMYIGSNTYQSSCTPFIKLYVGNL